MSVLVPDYLVEAVIEAASNTSPLLVMVRCRWRDIPRLLMHGKRIRVTRFWGRPEPYFLWQP